MLAAIIGGRLQGVEAACLARQAGWRTLLVDRDRGVPAERLADRFLQLDAAGGGALDDALGDVDLVVPALENQPVLDGLVEWGRRRGVPVAFDPSAYAVSHSKLTSNRLLAALGIPLPDPWPGCGFPVVAKPDCASGSRGVKLLKRVDDLAAAFPGGVPAAGWVLQQHLDGPIYSLEVIGRPGCHVPLQVTELFMDAAHDCKAVAAPSGLTAAQVREIEALGLAVARALRLNGLMDIEMIRHGGGFKVLEIDARIPSQTPLTVHASTGCNMIAMLGDLFLAPHSVVRRPTLPARGAILEHIRVTPDAIYREGEHVMGGCGPLIRVPGFFGADDALTSFQPGAAQWAATLIVRARSRRRAEQRRDCVLAAIQRERGIGAIVDSCPETFP